MKGCICCVSCNDHQINKRNLVTPCSDKWSCDTFIDAYEREKQLRQLKIEKEKEQWDADSLLKEKYKKYEKSKKYK